VSPQVAVSPELPAGALQIPDDDRLPVAILLNSLTFRVRIFRRNADIAGDFLGLTPLEPALELHREDPPQLSGDELLRRVTDLETRSCHHTAVHLELGQRLVGLHARDRLGHKTDVCRIRGLDDVSDLGHFRDRTDHPCLLLGMHHVRRSEHAHAEHPQHRSTARAEANDTPAGELVSVPPFGAPEADEDTRQGEPEDERISERSRSVHADSAAPEKPEHDESVQDSGKETTCPSDCGTVVLQHSAESDRHHDGDDAYEQCLKEIRHDTLP